MVKEKTHHERVTSTKKKIKLHLACTSVEREKKEILNDEKDISV